MLDKAEAMMEVFIVLEYVVHLESPPFVDFY